MSMSSFHEVRFPERISYGAKGGPNYEVDIVTTKAGYEHRSLIRPEALCKYNISCGIKRPEQFQQVIAFYRARKGKAIGFRFKDWTDFQAVNTEIGIGDGSTVAFQLSKMYKDEGGYEIRTISKPVDGTVMIYVDGVYTPTVTVDTTTGVVTFPAAPAASTVITADFEFDVPVRFDTDMQDMEYANFNSIQWTNISLVELLL